MATGANVGVSAGTAAISVGAAVASTTAVPALAPGQVTEPLSVARQTLKASEVLAPLWVTSSR